MKIPLSWLREYVPITLPPEELAHRLTMAGLEVASLQRVGGDWDPATILVGQVAAVTPHPNADRLKLATVDLGTESQTVVCGAPNVAPGQKVAFAREGARLFNTHSGRVETLKAATIRGVPSAGMVCSERELELGDDHTGILVLPDDAPVGTPLADYLGDTVLDLEVTPNRPDCLSILGVAREVAALTGQQATEPDLAYPETGDPIDALCTVQILDPGLCARYTASLVTGITVAPSPAWLQERLSRAGMRPINNVVDVTNYVMLEEGQPLHSFDFDALAGHAIIVRAARPGERLVTLDGEQHRLEPSMLVIADVRRAVALAGVMGGANTEMTSATTSVLLESATFNPTSIRRTAAALHLRSEASTRFDKGLSPELAPRALRRATQLILELAGGAAASGIADAYPGQQPLQPIALTADRVRRVLGMELPQQRIQQTLASLGFQAEAQSGDTLLVTPPYWRTDVTIPEDLVEEVARIIGYDQVPTTPISGPIPDRRPQPWRDLQERIRDILAAAGLQETISYSLVSRELLERVDALASGIEPLRMANPMSAAQEYLRTTLRGSILAILAANRRHTQDGIRIFEVGHVYLSRPSDLPEERQSLLALLSGPREPLSWQTTNPPGLGFYDARSVVETLLSQLGIAATLDPSQDDPILHPGRAASIHAQNGAPLGVVGEVHPRVLERFELPVAQPVALVELDLEALLQALPTTTRRYQPVSRFPGALRDLALVVDQDVPAGRLLELIRRNRTVAQATVFDLYQGKGIPQGKKSLAIGLLFQAPDRTLTSDEVSRAQEQILRLLEREVGATLRT